MNNEKERINKSLIQWIKHCRANGIIVNAEMVRERVPAYIGKSGRADVRYRRNMNIIAAFINRVSVRVIAEKFKLSEGTIYNVLARYGIKAIPSDKEKNKEKYKKLVLLIKKRIENGEEIKDIAKSLNLEEQQVSSIVNKHLSDLFNQKAKELEEAESAKSNKVDRSKLKIKLDETEKDLVKTPLGKNIDGKSDAESKEIIRTNAELTHEEQSKKKAENARKQREEIEKRRAEIEKREEAERNYAYDLKGDNLPDVPPGSEKDTRPIEVQKGSFSKGGIVPEVPEDEDYELIMKLVGNEDVSLTNTERKILLYLRAALKYSAEAYDMTDYSRDAFLVPEYILPIDIIIMKDIVERFNTGQSVESISRNHMISEDLVIEVLNGEIDRLNFRRRFFKGLIEISELFKNEN